MEKVNFSHRSVLLDECIEALNIKPDGIYVDGTAGGGGHSLEIVKRLDKGGRLIAIDRDDAAIAAATERLKDYSNRVTFVRNNFSAIKDVCVMLGVERIDGVLLDLGVSSYQLDTPERGFTHNTDAPLDMRMNTSAYLTAELVVNTYSEEDLTRILKVYGEETFAKQIARNIVKYRANKPLKTSGELAEIIRNSIPAKFRYGAPCERKAFQALRIEVNGELKILEQAIRDAVAALKPGGRIAVMTFHSLEDRIVKQAFQSLATGCTCPRDFPVCVCGKKPVVKQVNKKPILPSNKELEENPRSRSAKLRVAEKI